MASRAARRIRGLLEPDIEAREFLHDFRALGHLHFEFLSQGWSLSGQDLVDIQKNHEMIVFFAHAVDKAGIKFDSDLRPR